MNEFYKLPDVSLLKKLHNTDEPISMENVNEIKERIAQVLGHFDIGFSSIVQTVGPSFTLFEITLAHGVRMGKVRCLEDDIALSIASVGIRIIAPIPGKGTLGIEVPHQRPSIVQMCDVAPSLKIQGMDMDLPVILGKTITGETNVLDLSKAPHILIGGASGRGKSSTIQTLIVSLLLKKNPDELKFVIVDTKKTEYNVYEVLQNHFMAGIMDEGGHIITNSDDAVQVLESLCKEMDLRYNLLKKAGCRFIKEYNDKYGKGELEPEMGHRFMPYIVLVVDEFGDLILSRGKDVELPLCRIAQLARAVGIHAIIATQRPTTNIITGSIKANFPTRFSFRVASVMDSRLVIDQSGAQQLAAPGDMLVYRGCTVAERLQAIFTDRQDIERIVKYISEQHGQACYYPLPKVKAKELEMGCVDMKRLEQLLHNEAIAEDEEDYNFDEYISDSFMSDMEREQLKKVLNQSMKDLETIRKRMNKILEMLN